MHTFIIIVLSIIILIHLFRKKENFQVDIKDKNWKEMGYRLPINRVYDENGYPYIKTHDNKIHNILPADFIAEGLDQTRGWFYTLHAIATMIFDDVAYKNVVSNGLVLDKYGQKMSKRLGNAADPFETLDTHGPDATRWYMISNANP